MALIPKFLLRSLYKRGSLTQSGKSVELQLENSITFDLMIGLEPLEIDGEPHPLTKTHLDNGEQQMKASEVSEKKPFKLLKGTPITIQLKGLSLEPGSHDINIDIKGKAAGRIAFDVTDEV